MKTSPWACGPNRSLRRTGSVLSCMVVLLAVWASAAAAQELPPKDLRLFYQQSCAGCHGADGAGRDAAGKSLRGQDFTDPRWREGASDDRMAKVILKGKFFGVAMPGFKDALSRDEVQQMITEIIRKCEKGRVIEPLPKAAGSSR